MTANVPTDPVTVAKVRELERIEKEAREAREKLLGKPSPSVAPPPPAAPTKEDYRQIPWDGYEGSCPVCSTLAEWVSDRALYDRIRASDYTGAIEFRPSIDIGLLGGVQQEVFVVVCPNPNCKTVFFHYRQLFNREQIDTARERKKSHPATAIPDPIYSFQEGTVTQFLEELSREPNHLIRQRVVNRLRSAGVLLPAQ